MPKAKPKTHKKAVERTQKPAKPVQTKADVAYAKLKRDGYVSQTHIYPQATCASIILDYASGYRSCLGEDLEAMCKRFKRTKKHGYYHVKAGYFIPYDAWLINMVDASLKKHDGKGEQS